jgi:hypothetical protein
VDALQSAEAEVRVRKEVEVGVLEQRGSFEKVSPA